MNIGKKILNIRKEHELSQEQFGRQFHVTRQTVSNWENEKSYPDLKTLVEISDNFSVSLDSLLKEDPQTVAKFDKAKKKLKASHIIIIVLLLILIPIVSFMIRFSLAMRVTPNEKRNISYAGAQMYLNLPGSAPSRAIIRTYDKDEFDSFSVSRLSKIRDTVSGSLESDIPPLHLYDNEDTVHFIFQTDDYKNLDPDEAPVIYLRRYYDASEPLPADYEISDTERIDEYGNIEQEYRAVLEKDENGYYYTFSDTLFNNRADSIHMCYIEVHFTLSGHEYVALTAINLCYPDEA